MKKNEIISYVFLVVVEIGVIALWGFGLKSNYDAAAMSLIVAGIAAGMFLLTQGIIALRQKNFY